MSSQSHLDAEELENVPLVRMEDVQPDRSGEKVTIICKNVIESDSSQDAILETFVVEGSELHLEDDDSNIGSMVSIKSEELTVPEVMANEEFQISLDDNDYESQPLLRRLKLESMSPQKTCLPKPTPPDSWPTLEILPGGVINLAEKTDYSSDSTVDKDTSDVGNMIYACAKCSQGFKYLFCLVKHVRWHEEEAQRDKIPETKLTPIEKKMADLHRRGSEMDKIIKTQNGIVEIKPKSKMVKQTKEKYICLHSGKRKIVTKPKPNIIKRAPKKS